MRRAIADRGLRARIAGGSSGEAAWRSAADAGWLVGDYRYPHGVAGDLIVLTEGPTVVGYFHVDLVG